LNEKSPDWIRGEKRLPETRKRKKSSKIREGKEKGRGGEKTTTARITGKGKEKGSSVETFRNETRKKIGLLLFKKKQRGETYI